MLILRLFYNTVSTALVVSNEMSKIVMNVERRLFWPSEELLRTIK